MNDHGHGVALKDGGRVTDDCLPRPRTQLFFSRSSISFPRIGSEVITKRNDVVSELRRISQPGEASDRSNERGRDRVTAWAHETQHLPTSFTIGGDFDDVNDFSLPRSTHEARGRVTHISKIETTEKRPGIGHLSTKQGPGKSGPCPGNHLAASGSMQCAIGKQHHVDFTTFKNVLIRDLSSNENLDFQFEIIRDVEKRVVLCLHQVVLRPWSRTDGISGTTACEEENTRADRKPQQAGTGRPKTCQDRRAELADRSVGWIWVRHGSKGTTG